MWPGNPPPSLCAANALSNDHFRSDGVFFGMHLIRYRVSAELSWGRGNEGLL